MKPAKPPIQPLRTSQRIRCLSDEQRGQLQETTLRTLEEIGVRFPSKKALAILSEICPQRPRREALTSRQSAYSSVTSQPSAGRSPCCPGRTSWLGWDCWRAPRCCAWSRS
jgi:hypothetical protein